MPYGFEFPHYDDPKTNMDNIIHFYEHAIQQYNGLLSELQSLQKSVSGFYMYVQQGDARLDRKINLEISQLRTRINSDSITVQRQIADIQEKINDIVSNLNDMIAESVGKESAYLQGLIKAWETYQTQVIANINVDMARIRERVRSLENARTKIIELQAPVENPMNNREEELQDTLESMAYWLNSDGLTVEQLAKASNVHVDDLANWRVGDLLTKSRQYANAKGYNKYMRSPYSGEWERIKYVLNETINRVISDSWPIQDIAALGYTCADVSNKKLTVDEIFQMSKTYLPRKEK